MKNHIGLREIQPLKKLLGLGVLSFAVACSQQQEQAEGTILSPAPKDEEIAGSAQESAKLKVDEQVQAVESIIKEHDLYRYPTVTAYLYVKNAEKTSSALEAAGGEVLYNPNLSGGSQIKFLIANIPPRKLLDKSFVASLDLRAIQIKNPRKAEYTVPKVGDLKTTSNASAQLTVPIEDIGIPELQKNFNEGEELGEDVVVAVIDTGIDASHPIFQDRVVFWSDQTEETHVELTELNQEEGKVALSLANFDTELAVPASLEGKKLFGGLIVEEAMGAQAAFSDKRSQAKVGLDLNLDESLDDHFGVVLALDESSGNYIAYVDVNADGKISGELEEAGVVDFNQKRAGKDPSLAGMNEFVEFKMRSRTVKYPLLIQKNDEGQATAIRLGVVDGSHGTHVAGIVGGNGLGIKGPAPKAKFMSLKVCSGISCTTDAILRSMIETFYNPQGIVPDVVNISLGSHQQYSQDVMDFLMQDLASKFGTVFVVSASNSGPGHRSLNSIASFGPTIQVGAHASKETLEKLYTLDEETAKDMAPHHLLFFSSVGPSYTGHLRPNVIAPGAALSSTALIDNGVDMYNGTSMSSPIVAGAAAAILSVAKKDPAFATAEERRKAKIKSVLEEAQGNGEALPYSLRSHAVALRSALEQRAQRQSQYTMAQQGWGLVKAHRAYDEFIKLSNKVSNGDLQYFDVTLNGNSKSGALYQRDGSPKRSVEVVVGLVEDAEMSENDRLLLKTLPVTVRLEKVELQRPDGSTEVLDGKLPFALAARGNEGKDAREATVLFGSSRKLNFVSLRRTERMKAGNTYLAHYTLSHRGTRIQSVLDVVHVPIELPAQEQKVELSLLAPDGKTLRHAFAAENVKIGANEFHRYPIAITPDDTELSVELGIPFDEDGALFLQVYDPSGREVDFAITFRSDEVEAGFPTRTKIVTSTVGKPGIYEVTVAASYWRRYSATSYELLVNSDRLAVNKDTFELSLGDDSQILSISHPYASLSSLRTTKVTLEKAEHLEVQTAPSLWSFHKLSIPAGTQSLRIEIAPTNADLNFFGSIVPRLYVGVEEGQPKAVARAIASRSSNASAYFPAQGLPGEVYLALENFGSIPENGSLKATTSLPMRAIFGGIEVGQIELIKSAASTRNKALFQLVAPDALSNGAKAGVGSVSMEAAGKNVRLDLTVK